MNLKRLFLYLLIASVGFSALVGIGVILFGNFGEFEFRVLMTTLTITVTSILGLACGAYLETKRGRLMPIAGICFSIASAIMLFFVIWDVLDDSKIFIKIVLTSVILATSCSHLSLLSIARLDKRFAWSRVGAFICVWLLAAILLFILWFEPDSSSDLISRIIGVLSILIASVTVMTPVLHKLSNTNRTEEQIMEEIEELHGKIYHLDQERLRLQTLRDD